MIESLEVILRWFWISTGLFLIYSALLLLKTRRRAMWLRYTSVESGFWKRLGAPRAFATFAYRFGESRFSTICLAVITVLFAALTVLNASAYLHYKARLLSRQTAPRSEEVRHQH